MHRLKKRKNVTVIKMSAIILCGFVLLALKLGTDFTRNDMISSSTKLQKLMEDAEIENKQRLSRVNEVCKRYNLGSFREPNKNPSFKHPPAAQYTVFYIDRTHNISYCPIYKAGSTTWIYNLCLLMKISEEELNNRKEQLSTIARRVLPEMEYPEADEVLRITNKLLVVRHPFERILSAYRDKLENFIAGREHGTLHFYKKYGSKIVKKYRDPKIPKPQDGQFIKRSEEPGPAGSEPTFREFVSYLINTDIASYGDDHWMPYYLYCTPCLLQYDIVAKVESLWRDQVYAINKLGLQSRLKPTWKHSNGQSNNASRIYFSQLNKNMVHQLYEKYRLDFELFDYSPELYYDYSTSPY